jgi:hypothetical protein|tara:strand:- start:260 stop:613 length:354 start_codon:yes stop_codon:yes gene_type:complete
MKLLLEQWRSYLIEGKENHWNSFPPPENIQKVIDSNVESVTCAYGVLACQSMSLEWANIFRDAGIDVELHGGTYREEGHSWLVLDSYHLFDPTAAQFEDFPNIDSEEYVTHDIEDID